MKTKKLKTQKTDNSLEGWSNVIRQHGDEARQKEELRKKEAAEFLVKSRSIKNSDDRMRALLAAHKEGTLRLGELFDELDSWLGIDEFIVNGKHVR